MALRDYEAEDETGFTDKDSKPMGLFLFGWAFIQSVMTIRTWTFFKTYVELAITS